MDYKLEVVVIPVRDVDRSLAFYTQRCGFDLDTDYQPNEGFRLVQITPPGSACSLQMGIGPTDAEPGSSRNVVVAVDNIEAAREALVSRGVSLDNIRHRASIEDWQGDTSPGPDLERHDRGTHTRTERSTT